jgi:hypothetical protein
MMKLLLYEKIEDLLSILAFDSEWLVFLLVHGVSVLSRVNGLKSFILAMGMYLIVLMLGVSSAMGVS